ncbi:unnamed protein product [Symbiodinium natans]|uniref:Ammonium transporter AmtB-like domain-containing protein n=1 Tax=Symbiodinium natans TaxID=878477 RepID=A0A812P5R0_9DINO|nr:unnamed protein product [Symbiodinium natans]
MAMNIPGLNLTGLLPDERWIAEMTFNAPDECKIERGQHRADVIFVLTCAARIVQMQSGFAMLESAYQQPNNAANIMMKNMLDLCIGVLAFFLFGYYIAYHDTHTLTGLGDAGTDLAHFFCTFSYATTAATINSGALAGRVAFFPYLVLSTVMTGLLYPICAYLAWGNGWLQELGFVDFAGSVVVHQVGAISALVSTCFLGPRIGRFPSYRAWKRPWSFLWIENHDDAYYREPEEAVEKKVFIPFRKCRHPVQLLFGTFLLLVGFLAFNPASTFKTTLGADLVVAHASATTLLAAAGGGVGGMVFSMLYTRSTVVRVPELTNAVIAGLVASCAPAAVMPLSVSPLVGFVAAILSLIMEEVLAHFQIDDAVGAVAAHGPSGAWGAIAVALFAQKSCVNPDVVGIFFGGGDAGWTLLGNQLIGLFLLSGISIGITYISVLLIEIVAGFRCTRACELIGLDLWEHQFDDGSVSTNKHKAMLLDRATSSVNIGAPKGFWENFVEAMNGHSARRASLTPESSPVKSYDMRGPPEEKSLQDEVKELKKTVDLLQAQLALLALAKEREDDEVARGRQDIFGVRQSSASAEGIRETSL